MKAWLARKQQAPLIWRNDSASATAEWQRFLKDGRKGPQIRPAPSEETRRKCAGWECAQKHRVLSLRRAERRFCVYPKDILRGLPRATTNTSASCVYFFWWGPELTYIGKSVDIGARLVQHMKAVPRKPFTHVTYLCGDEDLIRDYEGDYVSKYKPPFNFTGTG